MMTRSFGVAVLLFAIAVAISPVKAARCSTGETCSWSDCGCGYCDTSGWNTCYTTCGSCGTSGSSYSSRNDDDDDDDDDDDSRYRSSNRATSSSNDDDNNGNDNVYGSSTEGVCKCTRTNGEKCDIEMGPVLAIISALSLCGMFCCCMGIFNNEDEDANPILAFFGLLMGIEFYDMLTNWIMFEHIVSSGCFDDTYVGGFCFFCVVSSITVIPEMGLTYLKYGVIAGEGEGAGAAGSAFNCCAFLLTTLPLMFLTATYNETIEDAGWNSDSIAQISFGTNIANTIILIGMVIAGMVLGDAESSFV